MRKEKYGEGFAQAEKRTGTAGRSDGLKKKTGSRGVRCAQREAEERRAKKRQAEDGKTQEREAEEGKTQEREAGKRGAQEREAEERGAQEREEEEREAEERGAQERQAEGKKMEGMPAGLWKVRRSVQGQRPGTELLRLLIKEGFLWKGEEGGRGE